MDSLWAYVPAVLMEREQFETMTASILSTPTAGTLLYTVSLKGHDACTRCPAQRGMVVLIHLFLFIFFTTRL